MKTVKVNIADFMSKYATAGVPLDVWRTLRRCRIKGETEAEVRDTIFDEMKIEQFYREHSELRPQIDFKVIEYSRKVINLMKDALAHRDVSAEMLADVQKQLGFELDRCKVYNRSTDEIQRLYDDVLWLRANLAL